MDVDGDGYDWGNTHSPAISSLVGGFNPSEKYEFVTWDDDIPNNYIWKNSKFMFQTTNQIIIPGIFPWQHPQLAELPPSAARILQSTQPPTVPALRPPSSNESSAGNRGPYLGESHDDG